MEILSLSEAKMKLSELIEKIQSTDQEVIITKNGRPAAVLVSPDEFEGWRETIAIKADADLMSEIKKGIAVLKTKSKVYTLEELFE
jgi:antitoxin YefM